MPTFVDPPTVHAPAASYSHHVVLEDCKMLMTSGQIGMRQDGTLPPDPLDQLKIAFANVRANLESAGMAMTDIVKLTIFLVGESDAEQRRAAIADQLGDHRPTMSVLYVAGLGTDAMKVEIEAIAATAR